MFRLQYDTLIRLLRVYDNSGFIKEVFGDFPMQKIIINVAILLLSLLGSLIVAEEVLRLLNYKPRELMPGNHWDGTSWAMPDDRLGWVNHEGTFPSFEPGHVPMSFSSEGARKTLNVAEPNSKENIVFLGCSITQGYGIADEETFANKIQGSIPKAKVSNYGTGGYSSYQSLLRMQLLVTQMKNEASTIYVYGLLGHHLDRNVATPDWIFSLTTTDGRYLIPPHAKDSSAVTFYGPQPVNLWIGEADSALITLLHRGYIRWRFHSSLQEKSDVMKSLVANMDTLAEEHNSRFLVVGLADVPAWFASWSMDNNIDFIDCSLPAYNKGEKSTRVGGVGHPNGFVNEHWAACLTPILQKELSRF